MVVKEQKLDTNHFSFPDQDHVIPVFCPHCGSHGLKYSTKDRIKVKTANTLSRQAQIEEMDPEGYSEHITGFLACQSLSCFERVIFSGYTSVEVVVLPGPYGMDPDYASFINIKYLHPSPSLIKVPKGFPQKYRKYLANIFDAYWQLNESCLNSIRILLEKILDDKKIKRYEVRNGSRKVISLNRRIKDHWKVEGDMKEMSLALKLLGNDGSHGDEITDEVKNLALDFLEIILAGVYDASMTRKLLTKARQINRKR